MEIKGNWVQMLRAATLPANQHTAQDPILLDGKRARRRETNNKKSVHRVDYENNQGKCILFYGQPDSKWRGKPKGKKENRLEVSKASILYTKTLEVYGGNLMN
jgi:hypothetical protein